MIPDAFDPRISLSVPKIAKWSGTEIALTSFICFNEAVLLESELIQKAVTNNEVSAQTDQPTNQPTNPLLHRSQSAKQNFLSYQIFASGENFCDRLVFVRYDVEINGFCHCSASDVKLP